MVTGVLDTEVDLARDLKRRVMIFLSQRGVTSLRRLNIQVRNGTVRFRGTVPSFYERQLCLSSHRVAGVYRVVDELKVEWPPKEVSVSSSPRTVLA